MDYEAIASEILGQGRQTEANEFDIEGTVAILRAHFPEPAPADNGEELRPDLGVCAACHAVLDPPQIERYGQSWCHVVAVDDGHGEPEPAPCGPVTAYYLTARPQPQESLQLGLAENTRQDMLRQLPLDLSERLKNAHIMDVWMVIADRLIPKEQESATDHIPEAGEMAASGEGLTAREIELIDGMIEVQKTHAEMCDKIANRVMADKQKGWDLERVALLEKIKSRLASARASSGEGYK